MNAAEHIVECYYRFVLKCLTITDVKVIDGVNRQCDLLAANLKEQKYYHVETSVTHRTNWAPDAEILRTIFDKKFRGLPTKKENLKSEFNRGKNYLPNIVKTYELYGMQAELVNRVFVCWYIKNENEIKDMCSSYHTEYNLKVDVISFRDIILPQLENTIGTSNYDDEILRTISFLSEKRKQYNL